MVTKEVWFVIEKLIVDSELLSQNLFKRFNPAVEKKSKLLVFGQ